MTLRSERLAKGIAAVEAHFGFAPSSYQVEIIGFAIDGSGHGRVCAVPGSGKSTTLEQCIVALMAASPAIAQPRVLMLAFNKAIATSLADRMRRWSSVACKTLNGLGYGILMRDSRFANVNVDERKTESVFHRLANLDTLDDASKVQVMAATPSVARMVALFKSYGYDAIRPFPTIEDIAELADKHDVEFPDEELVPPSQVIEWTLETFRRGNLETSVIDFDDQVYLPLHYHLPVPSYYRYVMIDESQDLNATQAVLIGRIAGRNGRAMFVGDEWQSIYGFRGADPESMATIARDFATVDLDLSICWRCSRAVVAEAAKINPKIQPAPDAIEGSVSSVKHDDFLANVRDGDMVLCRTTAPLVEYVYDLIREGKKAFIRGSDIGNGLKATLDKIAKKKRPGDPGEQIHAYKTTEVAAIKDEKKRSKMTDRMECLLVLAEGCETFAEVKVKIASIFSDSKAGIALSTIHKAKGLEADRVFIIHPELLPHPMAKKAWEQKQEINLKYVAITRAKVDLAWVGPKPKKKKQGETTPEPIESDKPKRKPRKKST